MSYPWENLIHPEAITELRKLVAAKGAEMLQLQEAANAVPKDDPDRWTRSGELVAKADDLDEIVKSLRIIADMAEALSASEKRELQSWR